MGRRDKPGRIQPTLLPMDRPSVVYRMRTHFERYGHPRLQLLLLIGFSGIAAFLVSFALLSAGVDSMAVAGIERRDWTATLLRRTWLPALTLIGLFVAGGWALQCLAPDARSIGPAIEQIRQ